MRFDIVSWLCVCFFFFKQKTAYEMRISDWSSDVCSSDLKLCQLLVLLRLCHLFRDDLEEELNGAPAIHGKLAADKVHSLHPIRAFVDHGDAGIADILLHARFHDVAVTAKHLLRIGCDF